MSTWLRICTNTFILVGNKLQFKKLSTQNCISRWLSTVFCPRRKTSFACAPLHFSITLQKTIKNMRKLSIVLLLIGISFITIEANTLSEHRAKRLVIKRWHQHRGVPVPLRKYYWSSFFRKRRQTSHLPSKRSARKHHVPRCDNPP